MVFQKNAHWDAHTFDRDPQRLAQRKAIEGLQLEVRLKNASKRDRVQVAVNGKDAGAGNWSGGTLAYQPDPSIFRPGENQVEVRISQRDPAATSAMPIIIESLEVKVDYRASL